MKVSILLPLYNVENYIERCARSVFEQTYEDIEIIFVDDKSSDSSLELLEEIMKKYPIVSSKVKVISNEMNCGHAVTRMKCLQNATGEFVMFVDSDDWIESNTVEVCVTKMRETDADIVVFFPKIVYRNRCVRPQCVSFDSKEKYVAALIERKAMVGLPCKLIRRSLFEQVSPCFVQGLNNGEDYSIISRIAYYAKSVAFLPLHLYYYNKMNMLSTGNSYKEGYIDQVLWAGEIVETFFWDRDEGRYNSSLVRAKLLMKSGVMQRAFCNKSFAHRRKELCNLFVGLSIDKELPIFDRVVLYLATKKMYSLIYLICNTRHFVAKIIKGKN